MFELLWLLSADLIIDNFESQCAAVINDRCDTRGQNEKSHRLTTRFFDSAPRVNDIATRNRLRYRAFSFFFADEHFGKNLASVRRKILPPRYSKLPVTCTHGKPIAQDPNREKNGY